MKIDFAGRTAIVAGMKGSVQRAIAELLAANGAAVATVSSEADMLDLTHLDMFVNVALDASKLAFIESFCRAAAERMSASGGRILNIVSAIGVVPVCGETHAAAAAAAVLALTRALALEFGGRGILVNALALGAIGDEPLAQRLISHVPLARVGTFDEAARAALFCVDPENSYMNGHVLLVDGGWGAGYARDF